MCALRRRDTKELVLGRTTLGDVLGDCVGFEEKGSVRAFECGGFAHGEFGEVFGTAVCDAHLEIGGGGY